MKLITAITLLATLPTIHAGKDSINHFGELEEALNGNCLNAVYQSTHSGSTLQCLSNQRFWTKISADASSECVEGRVLNINSLTFEATFNWVAYDFSVYVSTSTEFASTSGGSGSPFLMPLYGETCAVQSLSSYNDTSGVLGMITDADGDSCHDIIPSSSSSSSSSMAFTFTFDQPLLIPCSSYGMNGSSDGGKGTVHLQFCSTWRSEEDDLSCDAFGPHPNNFEGCACEAVDLGVKIVNPEDAVRLLSV
jgi:hypothetical protein